MSTVRRWKGQDVEGMTPKECRQALRECIDAFVRYRDAVRTRDELQAIGASKGPPHTERTRGALDEVFDGMDRALETIFGSSPRSGRA